MTDLVTTTIRNHVLLIGVHRAEKRNAWNTEIIRAVAAAYTELRDSPDLRCGVVYADGDHFTAGLDLADVAPVVAGGSVDDLLPGELCDPWDFFGEPCPKPIVVAAQGRCYTLGIELILASQAAVAASDTIFAQLEVARGIVPFGGATFRLPRLGALGKRWLFTAEEFGPEAALSAGMVTEVVAPGEQLDRAIELAEIIAAQAPLGVQRALASARASERQQRDEAAATIRDGIVELMGTADAMEGMAAMMERRDPKFTGS